MYRLDPITGERRLVAPGRALRLQSQRRGCPFCVGHEHDTPAETGRRPRRESTPTPSPWAARSFPNRFPLSQPHEVVVPTPEHATRWRSLSLPQLIDGLGLLLERRAALLEQERYVHAFINDGPGAGASISHVHAQLVLLERDVHTESLVAGVREADDCALCEVVADGALVVERGRYHTLMAHPVPRLGGGLLLVPNAHEHAPGAEHLGELAELLHRAWSAIDQSLDSNLWIVADEARGAHWYVELQPRSANLGGVELATGLTVSAAEPSDTAADARERLAMRG